MKYQYYFIEIFKRAAIFEDLYKKAVVVAYHGYVGCISVRVFADANATANDSYPIKSFEVYTQNGSHEENVKQLDEILLYFNVLINEYTRRNEHGNGSKA